MPIHNLQRQAHEVGRIRLGDKGAKGQPRKLDCFRLTSQNRALLCEAAEKYGGAVQPWEGHPGFFEVYLTVHELPFLASPVPISQWYELWKAGGCERRCDGEREALKDTPCKCDAEDRECKMTTRFSVFLYQLQGQGVFRLETHGYYAATELPAMAEMLIRFAKDGRPIPATLSIEKRSVKRAGEGVKNFIVPVIHTGLSIEQILLSQRSADPTVLLEGPKQLMLASGEAVDTETGEVLPAKVTLADLKKRADSLGWAADRDVKPLVAEIKERDPYVKSLADAMALPDEIWIAAITAALDTQEPDDL